jgi:hypothetical protein
MRTRAARLWIAVALAAGTAVAGAAVPVGAMRPVLHDVSRVVAVPAHVAATVSPSRVPGGAAHLRIGGQPRSAADDAALALTALVGLGVAVWLRRSRAARTFAGARTYACGCRAPPSGRL